MPDRAEADEKPAKSSGAKKRGRGRPEKLLTPDQRERYAQIVADGMGRVSAAKGIGVSTWSVRRTMKRYRSFARAVADAEAVPEETCLSVIFLKAVDSQDVAAAKAYVDTRMKLRSMNQARAAHRAGLKQQAELVDRLDKGEITPATTSNAAVLLTDFRRKMMAELDAQRSPLDPDPSAAG